MKRAYVKPMLVMESFAFNQTIASGCGYDHSNKSLGWPNHYGKLLCGWVVGNDVYFVEGSKACADELDEDAIVNGLCYNNPNGGATIFGS